MLKQDELFMAKTEASELGGEAGPTSLMPLPVLLAELLEVMSRVRPGDLSAAEIAALLGILAPANSRAVGRPAARPGR